MHIPAPLLQDDASTVTEDVADGSDDEQEEHEVRITEMMSCGT